MSSTPNLRFVFIAMLLVTFCFVDTYAQNTSLSGDQTKKVAKFNEKFDAADINHDGFLTRDEVAKNMPRVAKHFDIIDADHDGKLSRQEIVLFLAAKRKARDE